VNHIDAKNWRGMAQLAVILAISLLTTGLWAQTTAPATTGPAESTTTVEDASDTRPTTTSASAPAVEPDAVPVRVAWIRMAGEMRESPPEFALLGQSAKMTLRDWLHRFAEARNDDGVDAVAIQYDQPTMSWAQAQELADAIRRLAEVKPVHVHAVNVSATGYLVASAGTTLTMEPAGGVDIVGLAAEMSFFSGTMKLLGVTPQMIQIGRFKGAAEPFDREKPSEETIQMQNWLLDDLYDQLCQQIVTQRRLKVEAVKAAIDQGPLAADDAKDHGLIDGLCTRLKWRDELCTKIVHNAQQKCIWLEDYAAKEPPQVDLSNPFAVLSLLTQPPETEVLDPTVAIIHAEGMIVGGQSGSTMFGQSLAGAKTIIESFEQVRKDDNVKAVVFRIDSPGGSALASEQIYQAVKLCSDEKPVVVSIGQTGASGGYYIACGGRRIIADPAGIIGSIGVVSGKLALAELKEKIGVTTYSIHRGRNAGLYLSRPWTQREQEVIRRHAEKTYDLFVKRVREARPGIEKMEDVAEGRVFTARQARTNGLIDDIGGMREAIAEACKLAGIDRAHYLSLPRPRTLMELLAGDEEVALPSGIVPSAGIDAALLDRLLNAQPALRYMLSLSQMLSTETTLAAMPYYLEIK
jgi:protease-4